MAGYNLNGRKPLAPYPSVFTPPSGREIAGGIADKYGAGTVTRSIGSGVAAPPPPGSTPFQPPADAAVGSESFPDLPPSEDGSNIIDFQAPTDYEAESGMTGEPMTDAQEADQFMAAQRAQHDEFENRRAAIQPHIDAAIAGQPPPAATPDGAQPQPAPVGRPLGAFRKDVGTPITFKSPRGEAWQAGDEVGFNSASVEKANPGWTGKASWASRASMGGGYDGSVNAAPSQGRPDAPHNYSEQTTRFYDRVARRASAGNRNAMQRLRRI